MKSLLFFCLSTFLFYSCSKKENSLYPVIDLADAIENPVEKSVYDIAESVEVTDSIREPVNNDRSVFYHRIW